MQLGPCQVFLDRAGPSEALLVVCKSESCWKGRLLIKRLRGILNSAQASNSGLGSSHLSLKLALDKFLSLSGLLLLYL